MNKKDRQEVAAGDLVKVTDSFVPLRGGDEVTEVVGDIGRIDGAKSEDRYLVLFPDARGWFIPAANITQADSDDREPWWRPSR